MHAMTTLNIALIILKNTIIYINRRTILNNTKFCNIKQQTCLLMKQVSLFIVIMHKIDALKLFIS